MTGYAAGLTMLEHAVIEHNMLAVSKIYRNISFIELQTLLHIHPAQVGAPRLLWMVPTA